MPLKKLDEKKRKKYKDLLVRLTWKLLEMKYLYYEGAKVGLEKMIPPDSEYDF